MNIFFRSVKKHFEDFNKNYWPVLHNKLPLSHDNFQHQNVVLFPSQFLHDDLRKRINAKPYWKHSCYFAIQNINVHVVIFSTGKSPKGIKHILWVTAFMIYYCLRCRNDISQHEPYNVDITLVLSPYKKTIPNSTQTLTSYHINSGVTSTGDNTKAVIVVFRREEVIKVLIHELIHAMRLDRDSSSIPTTFFQTYFGLSSNYHLNLTEAFTEAYACLLNVAIASLILPCNKFNTLLEKEKQFVLAQGTKVIFKLQFELDAKGHLLPNKKPYQETTNIISYYILKAVVFANINVFLQLLSSPSWNFSLSYISFVEFLEKYIGKTLFNKHASSHKFKDLSLKMSSIDTLKLGY